MVLAVLIISIRKSSLLTNLWMEAKINVGVEGGGGVI